MCSKMLICESQPNPSALEPYTSVLVTPIGYYKVGASQVDSALSILG